MLRLLHSFHTFAKVMNISSPPAGQSWLFKAISGWIQNCVQSKRKPLDYLSKKLSRILKEKGCMESYNCLHLKEWKKSACYLIIRFNDSITISKSRFFSSILEAVLLWGDQSCLSLFVFLKWQSYKVYYMISRRYWKVVSTIRTPPYTCTNQMSVHLVRFGWEVMTDEFFIFINPIYCHCEKFEE